MYTRLSIHALYLVFISLLPSLVSSATFIVRLQQGTNVDTHLQRISEVFAQASSNDIHYRYPMISGYAITVPDEVAESIHSGQSPEIAYVEKDSSIHIAESVTNAPWGLERISQRQGIASRADTALNFTYSFDEAAGGGVEIYTLDTGVRASHQDFGGRASEGPAFGYPSSADGNGHGTHVAGTAIGAQYGVAKSAHLIALKVLSDGGSGTVSDIIAALQYVSEQKQGNPEQPIVVSMSIGGGVTQALDDAVSAAIDLGIHVAVAAGNDDVDACNSSPARVRNAITVAASNIADQAASFSNYGSCVDIWAPGQNVVSAWYTSNTAQQVLSGTSMATPHISGLVAYLISVQGDTSPASMSDRIKSLGTQNLLSGVSSGINDLAFNGYQQQQTAPAAYYQ